MNILPLNEEQLALLAPYSKEEDRLTILDPLNKALTEFSIDTPLKVSAFIAQILVESGNFHYLEEIADGSAYEDRKDLGNLLPEALACAHFYGNTTGKFYKGRGLIAITGYLNYKECGQGISLDLTHHPELLKQPDNAALSAAWFWDRHHLNNLAEVSAFDKITYAINGGYNNAITRTANYNRCKKVLQC